MPRLAAGEEKRDARMALRLPRRLREAIDRAAKRDRRKATDWVILALEDATAASDAAAARAAAAAKPKK